MSWMWLIRLFELVDQGKFEAIKFLLSTRGRSRGYGEVQDINLNGQVTTQLDLSKLTTEQLKLIEEAYKQCQI
jgi:hypothetical protein